jgi:ribosomal protein S27E
MKALAFFQNEVTCHHCDGDTYGVVYEYSGTINCDSCDEIIFDARDTSGTVVILELEEPTVQ